MKPINTPYVFCGLESSSLWERNDPDCPFLSSDAIYFRGGVQKQQLSVWGVVRRWIKSTFEY